MADNEGFVEQKYVTLDLRTQLARDLLVAHVRKHGMTTNPAYESYTEDRTQACQSAADYADLLIAALAKPQEGGE